MQDKKIKIWLSVLVASLMVTGGVASYLGQKNSYYKGLENVNAFSSVLQATEIKEVKPVKRNNGEMRERNEVNPEFNKYAQIIQSSFNSPAALAAPQKVANQEDINKKEILSPVKAPCENGAPVIKNGTVVGCSN